MKIKNKQSTGISNLAGLLLLYNPKLLMDENE